MSYLARILLYPIKSLDGMEVEEATILSSGALQYDVRFLGINPCQRCVVPTRDTYTGEAYPNFQKIFGQKRQATMPTYVNTAQFNHFYRLSVNTRVPVAEVGKIITLGSSIEICQ
ncbi:MOSC N-terminal beta barrel domain-containing protein [Aphanizomenon sp. CS-733/32]|uniref:MOSC N-terminal beta barrel domain-containing protein n=1 Tax=Aphanizomenon sp. CS-733/32 TaxID=3021715 RepID=UPI00232A90D4|nr:MOSC N-terminal beta barrel domain-containing protein [Aphanizomenon sp. CS-733/32]MDB9310523.1 MOSC N-terminal beta barrel domain-containing protein [Aphanizomenon sp. CS-733/32]